MCIYEAGEWKVQREFSNFNECQIDRIRSDNSIVLGNHIDCSSKYGYDI